MRDLIKALMEVLPQGMDYEEAIQLLIGGFRCTRRESEVALLRCVEGRDAVVAEALGIELSTLREHAKWGGAKLGTGSTRVAGPKLVAFLYRAWTERCCARFPGASPKRRG
jgi:hypothetical protein